MKPGLVICSPTSKPPQTEEATIHVGTTMRYQIHFDKAGLIILPGGKGVDQEPTSTHGARLCCKKAHEEIMATLAESNAINGEEIQKLDKRVTAIETEYHIAKN